MTAGTKGRHQHGKKGCVEKLKKMSGYIDGELETPAKRSLEEHLANCPPCLMVLKSLRKTLEIFKYGEQEKMPDGLADELKRRIEAEKGKGVRKNG